MSLDDYLSGALAEITILDTGSTDGSQEIARAAGARIFEEPWRGDFAWARNRVAELCGPDWLFVLDGDEELIDGNGLDEVLASDIADGGRLMVDCFTDGRLSEKLLSTRLYRRSVGRWKYPVHNQLLGLSHVMFVPARVIAHYETGDTARNLEARAQVLECYANAHPEDPIPAHFMTQTLIELKHFEQAVVWARRALAMDCDSPASAPTHCQLVEAFIGLGDEGAAIEALRNGLRFHPGWPDLMHYQVTFAVKGFFVACQADPERYSLVPSKTRHLGARVEDAVEILGLPIYFGDSNR